MHFKKTLKWVKTDGTGAWVPRQRNLNLLHILISEDWLSIGHIPGEESASGSFDFARLTQ